jgi:Ca2+-binding EF-hand superfamily protein
MATTFQQHKLEKVFDSFDLGHKGVIDELDLVAMAQIWCETYDATPNSLTWRKIHGQARGFWRGIQASMESGDVERITKADWVAYMDKPGFAEFVEKVAIPFSMAVFDAADKDGDGRITVEEMMAGQGKSGMSEQETRSAFELLDIDHDGLVTADEYVQAAREFYLSEDPDAPGNLIAGDL